jgi:hypothetical protein
MKITKTQLRKIIQEEVAQINEGIPMEDLAERPSKEVTTITRKIGNFLKNDLPTWNDSSLDQLMSDLETQELDLTQQVLDIIKWIKGTPK